MQSQALFSNIVTVGILLFAVADTTVPNADFVLAPTSLSLSSEYSAENNGVISATHRSDGNILVGCTDGARLFHRSTKNLTKCDLPNEKVFAAIEKGQVVYLLTKEEGTTHKVVMCLPNFEHAQPLFRFENSNRYVPSMTASDKHIVVFSFGEITRKLIIYDIITKKTKTTEVELHHQPHLLADGHLLAAGGHRITKYKIEGTELIAVWTCERLKDVFRIATDSNGLIYAITREGQKVIYVISPNGNFLVN